MQAPPGIFFSSFAFVVWQRFLRPGELGWVCSLHGLRQAKNGREVSEEYWLAVTAARSLQSTARAKLALRSSWGLFASVLLYASVHPGCFTKSRIYLAAGRTLRAQ